MKKKLTVLSLGFIGAAILWFLCLIAAHLFFDVNIFEKDFSSFIWRFLIILLIVGISGLLLLTSVSIYEDNKTLAYISGAMILVTALFALLFFLIGKYEKGFLSMTTLTFVIVSLLVNQLTDMQYRAKKSLTGLKIATGRYGRRGRADFSAFGVFADGKTLGKHGVRVFLCGALSCVYRLENRRGRDSQIGGRKERKKSEKRRGGRRSGRSFERNGDEFRAPEYENLLRIKAEYERSKK